MDELKSVTFLPFNVTLNITVRASILDAIKKANLPVTTSCGGKGTCGDYIVRVLKGKYTTSTSAALSENIYKQGYVLAWKTDIIDDLVVQLPKFKQLPVKAITDIGISETNKKFVSGYFKFEPPVNEPSAEKPSSPHEIAISSASPPAEKASDPARTTLSSLTSISNDKPDNSLTPSK